MTVQSELRKSGVFVGDGAQKNFPFTFKVFEKYDIRVVVSDGAQERVLTHGQDYQIVLAQDQEMSPGGEVVLQQPLALGHLLVIASAVANLQLSKFTNHGGFYPVILNDALDKLTILVQQLNEKTERSVRFGITAGLNAAELPPPGPGLGIGWNDAGDRLVNTDYHLRSAAAMAAAQAALADAQSAAALAEAAAAEARAAVPVIYGPATTTEAGITRLSHATDSTAEDRAATPKAVKAVHDYAVSVNSAAQQALDGKAALVHRHTTADIDGLDVALAGIAVPTGTIVYIGGTTAPAGWLKLNGAVINVSAYPALAERVWVGDADNATADYFYRCSNQADPNGSRSASGAYLVLADARGEFIRGWDDGRGVDVGRKLGTWQKGSLMLSDSSAGGFGIFVPCIQVAASPDAYRQFHGLDKINHTDYAEMFAGGNSGTGSYTLANWEHNGSMGSTRPRNLAGLAIIKI